MNTFNNFRNLIFTISALISISALLWFTDLYKQSVTDGLLGCCNVLVPSLFPFFFLSSFIVYSDCFSVVTKKLSWAEKLTGISPQGLLAVLLCVIGGFLTFQPGENHRKRGKKAKLHLCWSSPWLYSYLCWGGNFR